MIQMLGLLFGGFIRLVPEFLKLFSQHSERSHEFRMSELQLQIDKARAAQAIDLVHANAGAAEAAMELRGWIEAIAGQGKATGIPWVDALSATVRPVLTYWWCLVLYTTAKLILIVAAVNASLAPGALALLVVTEFDQMIIASIFSFWFVDRSLKRGK